MSNVVDIKTRQPPERLKSSYLRAAAKLVLSGDLFQCPCVYRELYGPQICDGCPSNPDQTTPPEDAA